MMRALAMSKFWQKRQPELQPAVPKLSTLEPGWKWLRGFFSIAGLDGNCLWLPQHRHLDIQQWVFRSGNRVETWVTGSGIHRMGNHILAKWLMGNQRANAAAHQRHSAVFKCCLLGHQPLETEIDVLKTQNPPLETQKRLH